MRSRATAANCGGVARSGQRPSVVTAIEMPIDLPPSTAVAVLASVYNVRGATGAAVRDGPGRPHDPRGLPRATASTGSPGWTNRLRSIDRPVDDPAEWQSSLAGPLRGSRRRLCGAGGVEMPARYQPQKRSASPWVSACSKGGNVSLTKAAPNLSVDRCRARLGCPVDLRPRLRPRRQRAGAGREPQGARRRLLRLLQQSEVARTGRSSIRVTT